MNAEARPYTPAETPATLAPVIAIQTRERIDIPQNASNVFDIHTAQLKNIIEPSNPLDSLPLTEIPLTEDLDVSAEDESVADHEFMHHALVAYKIGVAVEKVSIIPKPGEYRGVTIVKSTDAHKLQIVAAAGGVHGDGAGSDMAKVSWHHRHHGGLSPEAAMASAEGFIKSIDPKVRRIANRILAHKKEISGQDIPLILERAHREATMYDNAHFDRLTEKQRKQKMKKATEYASFVGEITTINNREFSAPIAGIIAIRTIEEDLGNGRVRRYDVKNGSKVIESEKELCRGCRLEIGHMEKCPYIASSQEDIHEQRPPAITTDIFPSPQALIKAA